jgi:NitT/TauT family transport system substrate-binding protein
MMHGMGETRRGRWPGWLAMLAIIGTVAIAGGPAAAETNEIRMAQQYGMIYLPLHVMVEHKLVEKHAALLGHPDLKLSILQLSSGAAVNEAVLSGAIDIATVGATVLLTVWDKTRGRANIHGMMALCDSPILFNSSDPRIRTIADFGENDRIAVTAVKVTHHAVILQMAAAKYLGWENRFKLDPLTVSLSHPDSMIAILAPHHEIRTHAATIPFLFQELRDPRVHTVLNSYDVVGGRHTVAVVYNTEKWKNDNPKSYRAVADALTEAMAWIEANKREAAELYVRVEKTQLTADDVYGFLQQEDKVLYTPTPSRMMVHAEFMHKIGSLKNMPESWKELFFDNVHDLPGS